ATLTARGAGNTNFPGISRVGSAALRQRGGVRIRQDPRLLRRAVDVRAAHLRARAGRRRPGDRGIHARLLPPGAGPVPRGDGDEAVARDPQEPEAAEAAEALSGGEDQAVLRARLRADRGPLRAAQGELTPFDDRIGDVYLDADELATRVQGLGAELAQDYDGREPILVGLLKACVPFLIDLSRALPIVHAVDFVQLAGYGAAETGG